VIVIAGGTAYIMNPNKPEPIRIFDYDISEIIEMDDGSIIISNETDIIILDEYGKIKQRYDDIGFDGISNLKLEKNILTGLCYNIFITDNGDSWQPFFINLDTKEVAGGCSQPEIFKEKKPWYRYVWFGGMILLLYYQFNK
jgi:hypothetical protein